MPKISVITTLYNCQKYVKASIQSILDQTYDDFELILVNDGSSDKTWEIVNQFKDDRIVLVDRKINKKIPYSRNEAITHARGKYLAIHDGDDISLSSRLEKQVLFLEKHPFLFCVGAHALKIDEQDNELEIMSYPPALHSRIEMMFYRGQNPMIDPTTMFKKEDFVSLGCYNMDDKLYTVPDMDLWSRGLLKRKLFANMQVPLIRYRINTEGVTRKNKEKMIEAHKRVMRNYRFLRIKAFSKKR